MSQSNIITNQQPAPDTSPGESVLVDATLPITNAGPNVVAEFQAAANEVFDVRVYLYANAVADPTYKVHRNVIVAGTAIGGGALPVEAGAPTFGALNWNVNCPSTGPGTVQITVQTLGADTPRMTRVRVVLVRPSFVELP
jgi:hypothetical protein